MTNPRKAKAMIGSLSSFLNKLNDIIRTGCLSGNNRDGVLKDSHGLRLRVRKSQQSGKGASIGAAPIPMPIRLKKIFFFMILAHQAGIPRRGLS